MITIYALAHPETLEVRYVGLTRDLQKRLRQYRLGHGHTKYLRNWVKSLPSAPYAIVLEQVADSQGDGAERHWIGTFRQVGARLLNYTDGGEGAFTWTPEMRANISVSRKRWLAQDPARRVMAPETRAKISAALKGKARPWAGETLRRLNKSRTGVPLSETHRKRIGAASTGRKASPETLERKRAAGKELWTRPEFRAKMDARWAKNA